MFKLCCILMRCVVVTACTTIFFYSEFPNHDKNMEVLAKVTTLVVASMLALKKGEEVSNC